MRSHFDADWAFGIQGAMENIVRENFPSQVRQWPLLQSFDAEGYQVGTEHFVIVLRDRLSGIPTTAGSLKPFPYEDHPSLPPSSENMVEWMSYLIDRFSLRNEDVAMVLPIHDSGQHGAPSDYELFTDDEKWLWNYQISFWIARHGSALQVPTPSTPDPPTQGTFIVSGTNNRITINASDNSVNVVNQTPPEVFQQLLEAVRGTEGDPQLVAEMVAAVEEMQQDYGSDNFLNRYQSFMSLLSDHMQVFGPAVAPYLPVLAQLLSTN